MNQRGELNDFYVPIEPNGEQYEILLCRSGKGKYRRNGQQEGELSETTVMFVRLGEVYELFDLSEDFQTDRLSVKREEMHFICQMISEGFFDGLNAIRQPIVWRMAFDDLNGMRTSLERIRVLSMEQAQVGRRFLTVRILNEIFERFIVGGEALAPKWLEEIIRDISNPENFAKSLEELLEKTFFSRAYISVSFKRYTGETLVRYRNKLKVKYSLSLLQKDVSINEIAKQLGWENPQNYIISFRKVYGQTPLEYKNSTN